MTLPTASPVHPCHLCGAVAVQLLPAYTALKRVTSDCKVWPEGGLIGQCAVCYTVQNPINDAWYAERDAIYAGYTIYHQSGGIEQPVFQPDSGDGASRSERLLTHLAAHLPEKAAGRALDVGCGNGAMLRALSARRPGWRLLGTEFDAKYKALVESISGVETMFVGSPQDLPGTFDLISLIHVLEHIQFPLEFLQGLYGQIEPGGLLVIEVPNHDQNPFDLLIADHCSHFTPATLPALIRRAGFGRVEVHTDWVAKELSLVAYKEAAPPPPPVTDTTERLPQQVAWLGAVVAAARDFAAHPYFGLFGTSIAATWLYGELGDDVRFFVDEDPHRAGRTYHDRPIYAPAAIPARARVLLALPPAIAARVQARLSAQHPGIEFVLPPQL